LDGSFVDACETPPDPFTRGEGLFETMLVREGRPILLDDHLGRLARSARALSVPLGAGIDAIRDGCLALPGAAGMEGGRMRAALDRGLSVVTLEPFAGYPTEWYESGAECEVAAEGGHPQGERAGHKVLPYSRLVEAREAARRGGAIDLVFRDADGALLEGAASNLFVCRNGVPRTPPTSRPILPGVTRDHVIRHAREEGVETREEDVFPEDVARADEAFLTGSLMEVVPLRRLGESRLDPGPLAAALLASLRRPRAPPP
jgi:branched-subunit amino acid aminotransferase/4-amino-4-deoxychorismate lyase